MHAARGACAHQLMINHMVLAALTDLTQSRCDPIESLCWVKVLLVSEGLRQTNAVTWTPLHFARRHECVFYTDVLRIPRYGLLRMM